MAIRLRPIIPPASDVLMVGDPRRAFTLAQEVLEQPRMSHQARGLWGYTGATPEGRELTVQASGSGAPSAVSVMGGLAGLGARRVLRLGTAVAVDPELPVGRALLVREAEGEDGVSRHLLAPGEAARPDGEMLARLQGAARPARVASRDLPSAVRRRLVGPAGEPEPRPEGVVATDLQTAALLAAAVRLGIRAAAVLLVAEDASGAKLEDEELEELAGRLAASAVPAAFGAAPSGA